MPGKIGRRRGRGWGLCVLLFLLIQPIHRAAAAPPGQPAGLTMTVQAGYDGHYKLGEWFPVQVTLSNTGQPLPGAEVQVDALGNNDQPITVYARPVDLPAPSRKQVTLFTYAASFQHAVHVRLVREHTVLLEQTVSINPLSNGFLLGVVSDSPDLLNSLSNTPLGNASSPQLATVAHLAPADLPAGAAVLNGLDGLVLANTDTSKLSPEARAAIGGWVLNGGALVVAGGAAGPATTAGVADLLPVTFGASGPAGSLDSLGQFAGAPAPAPGGALVSAAQLVPGIGATALITDAGGVLLAARVLGSGQVLALSLDPSQPPLKTWDANPAFWQRIFAAHTVQLSAAGARRSGNWYRSSTYTGNGSYYVGELSPFDLPMLQLPPVGTIAGFLFLYVLAVGPINYLILRRQKRVEWAWVTIPAIILLFAGGAYLIGYQSKGNELRLTTATLVRTAPGTSLALVDSFVGLFSPNRETYDLQFGGDVQLSEVNGNGVGGNGGSNGAPTIDQGKPSRVPNLTVDTWALRSFQAETTVAYPAPYETLLQLDTNRVTGSVTNRGKNALTDVVVIVGGEIAQLGALGAGQQAQVALNTTGGTGNADLESLLPRLLPGIPLQTWPPPNSAEERAGRRRAALLVAALESTTAPGGNPSALIAGWSAAGPLDVQVAGRQAARDDLVLVTEQVPLTQAPGHVSLGAGLIARRVIDGRTTPSTDTTGSYLQIFGSTTFEYVIPADIQVDQLLLDYALHDGGYSDPAQLQLFNWRTKSWDEVLKDGQNVGQQTSFSGPLAAPADHISPNGHVQVRVLSANGTNGRMIAIERLDLRVEGRH